MDLLNCLLRDRRLNSWGKRVRKAAGVRPTEVLALHLPQTKNHLRTLSDFVLGFLIKSEARRRTARTGIVLHTAAEPLQSCPTLCDPMGGSPPGSPSLGLSRQDHWSGVPFPSPRHESEKRKGSRSVVSSSYRPNGLQPTRLLRPWDSPGKRTGVGCHRLLRLLYKRL